MNYSRFLKYAKWGLENEIEKLKEEIENNKKHPEYSENSEYSAINGLYYRLIQEYERDLNFINRKVNDETTFVDIY